MRLLLRIIRGAMFSHSLPEIGERFGGSDGKSMPKGMLCCLGLASENVVLNFQSQAALRCHFTKRGLTDGHSLVQVGKKSCGNSPKPISPVVAVAFAVLSDCPTVDFLSLFRNDSFFRLLFMATVLLGSCFCCLWNCAHIPSNLPCSLRSLTSSRSQPTLLPSLSFQGVTSSQTH